jgi:hypothetical protein
VGRRRGGEGEYAQDRQGSGMSDVGHSAQRISSDIRLRADDCLVSSIWGHPRFCVRTCCCVFFHENEAWYMIYGACIFIKPFKHRDVLVYFGFFY